MVNRITKYIPSWQQTTQVGDKAKKTVKVIRFSAKLLTLSHVAKSVLDVAKRVDIVALGTGGFIGGVGLAVGAHIIQREYKIFTNSKSTTDQKVNAFFMMFGSGFATVSFSTSDILLAIKLLTVGRAVEIIAVIGQTALGVAALLSLLKIALHAKNIHELRKHKVNEENTTNSKIKTIFEEKTYDNWKNIDTETQNNLKKRDIKMKAASEVLSIVLTTMTIIAVALLIFHPPALAAACILFAAGNLSALIIPSMIKLLRHQMAISSINKNLKPLKAS